jgi:hypothetical protein
MGVEDHLIIAFEKIGFTQRRKGAKKGAGIIHGDINNCALLISALSASLRDKKVSRRGAEAAENVNRG